MMPRGWTRTRVDKEGDEIRHEPGSRDDLGPDLTDPTNVRRACAVLRDVATRCNDLGEHTDVDVLQLVPDVGDPRTPWSTDCALAALADHRHQLVPPLMSWPDQMPAGWLRALCRDITTRLEQSLTDTRTRR